MSRPPKLLFAACLATVVAAAASEVIAAEEGAVATQDLVNVRAAAQVTASWTKQPDFYALQVVMETSKPSPPRSSALANQPGSPPPPARTSSNAEEMQQLKADTSEGAQKLVPQSPPAMPIPRMAGDVSLDRGSFFIGNTIANLRGLDPTFGCRTLTLVDGRRVVGGQPPAASAPPVPVNQARPVPLVQSYPPKSKHPRVDVWLLKADGTQILPAAYTCVVLPAVPGDPALPPSASRNKSDEITYRFSLADSAQAVAAAIRIDNDFYIEKLRPLEYRPSGQ